MTNDAATLQGLYPGLIVTSSTNWFETVYVTTLVPYFTNTPYDPAYTPPRLAFATIRTLQVQQKFKHTFDNLRVIVYTNGAWSAISVSDLSSFMGYGVETLEEVAALVSSTPTRQHTDSLLRPTLPGGPMPRTRWLVNFSSWSTNVCDVVLIAPQLTITNQYTNLSYAISTNYAVSNATVVTNITETYTASIYSYSTNHVFAALPITCLQSNLALSGGIEKMSFVRRDFDSLLGRFFTPITNNYTLMTMTNNTLRPMRVIRPVTQPDFLFTAVDSPLTPGPAAPGLSVYSRNVNFSTNGTSFYPGLAGPGTIETPSTITFNKGTPVWFNYSGLNAYDPERAEASSFLFWYLGFLRWHHQPSRCLSERRKSCQR